MQELLSYGLGGHTKGVLEVLVCGYNLCHAQPIVFLSINHQLILNPVPVKPFAIGKPISNAEDAIEFLLAGASLIGVGTALAKDPLVADKIVKGIQAYMKRYGYTNIRQLTGALTLHDNSSGCTPASCLR